MTTLSQKAIKEFKALWKADHPDQEISQEELEEKAYTVMRAVKTVYCSSNNNVDDRELS